MLNKKENVIIELYITHLNDEIDFPSRFIIEFLDTTYKINNKIVIQLFFDHFNDFTFIDLSDFLLSSIH